MEKWYPWRLSACFLCICKALSTGSNLDVVLSAFFRSHPKLGKRDRDFVWRQTFDFVRNMHRFSGGSLLQRFRSFSQQEGWNPPIAGHEACANNFEKLMQSISLDYSFTKDFVDRLRLDWPEQYEVLLMALGEEKEAFIRINKSIATDKDLLAFLNDFKPSLTPYSELSPHSYSVKPEALNQLNQSNYQANGTFEWQDLGSQRILFDAAKHISLSENAKTLDLCAGEGGKSLQLVHLFNGVKHHVFDTESKKLIKLKKRFNRLPLLPFPIILSAVNLSSINETMDFILIDAPCSGTGTFGRLPIQRYFFDTEKVEELIKTQSKLLEQGNRLLKKNGYLLYATCSVQKSENDHQIAQFLSENKGFQKLDEQYILPTSSHDGFYYALLQKNALA